MGPLTFYREGMLQGVAAAARVMSDMGWMAAVFLTTPFDRVLDALKWYRVPAILLDTIAMTYRYAFLLMAEFHHMRDAGPLPGGFRSYRNSQHSTGLILAQVILRAYDRAGRIQDAMVARGANASPPVDGQSPPSPGACPNRCDITPVLPDAAAPVLACTDLSFGYGGNSGFDRRHFRGGQRRGGGALRPQRRRQDYPHEAVRGDSYPSGGGIALSGTPLDRKSRNDAFRRVGILSQDPNDQLFCTHVAVSFFLMRRKSALPKLALHELALKQGHFAPEELGFEEQPRNLRPPVLGGPCHLLKSVTVLSSTEISLDFFILKSTSSASASSTWRSSSTASNTSFFIFPWK